MALNQLWLVNIKGMLYLETVLDNSPHGVLALERMCQVQFSSKEYSNFRNYATPNFYRKYATAFFDSSFLQILS